MKTLVEDTAHRIAHLRATPEAGEGIAAFLEKRAPAWVGGLMIFYADYADELRYYLSFSPQTSSPARDCFSTTYTMSWASALLKPVMKMRGRGAT